jgi:hypothetical protein
MRQEEGFKFFLDTKSNKALPWLLYFSTLVAFNVHLSWFMNFAMEFFCPISFGFQFYLVQYITKSNNFVITKHQVPLGMSKLILFNIYRMVNLKNKIGLF